MTSVFLKQFPSLIKQFRREAAKFFSFFLSNLARSAEILAFFKQFEVIFEFLSFF